VNGVPDRTCRCSTVANAANCSRRRRGVPAESHKLERNVGAAKWGDVTRLELADVVVCFFTWIFCSGFQAHDKLRGMDADADANCNDGEGNGVTRRQSVPEAGQAGNIRESKRKRRKDTPSIGKNNNHGSKWRRR